MIAILLQTQNATVELKKQQLTAGNFHKHKHVHMLTLTNFYGVLM